MSDFVANISFLFSELPFLDRFQAARNAGFAAVECHYPYNFPVSVLADMSTATGMPLTGINTRAGDREKGEWGFAAVPGAETRFARDFDEALRYAAALGMRTIHVLAGIVSPGHEAEAFRTYVANMRIAAQKAREHGVNLLLEPLNIRDAPGYFVAHADKAAGIIAEVGAPNLKLLFDIYHVQITDGDLTRRIERHKGVIGHVQIAGVPDRAEPDARSEVNTAAILAALEAGGYAGLIAAEYKPRARTEDGLGWLTAYSGA